jgi:putative phage-type endonuclease
MNGKYLFVDLKQGSQEWIEWRHNGIGASDAPVIMGKNPWKNVRDLLSKKLGPPIDDGADSKMNRGTQLEPQARNNYNQRYSSDVRPVCIQSKTFNWLKASIDGLSLDNKKIVEIKCGDSIYRKIKYNRTVPEYYHGQLQHILAITGLPEIDFFCYWPGNPDLLITIPRNDTYIERLINAETLFWDKVKSSIGR